MTLTHEKTIAHLSKRLAKELPNKIESIILYGSAARNQTHEDSDIDILIITQKDDKKLYDKISKIRTQIDLDNNTLTALVQMSKNELERYLKLGSPFLENVMKQGVPLYDRGLFKKIRGSLTQKS